MKKKNKKELPPLKKVSKKRFDRELKKLLSVPRERKKK
jgi:hypothetical protein